MIRCTRNLLLILVTTVTLTGCTAYMPGMAGPQFTGEIVAQEASAGGAPATLAMIPSTRVASATTSPTHTVPPSASAIAPPTGTATVQPTAAARATASAIPTLLAPTPTHTPTATASPTATSTPTPLRPELVVLRNANVRSGPGTVYPIIGGVREGQCLRVIGQYGDWWQITLTGRAGWIWGPLGSPNAAARLAPQVKELPPLPPTPTPAPTATPSPQQVAQADLIVLGPDTQYPVRARVIRGWDYESVDLSEHYDIVVYRDVFGMLSHQIDDENVRRYRLQSYFVQFGPLRVTLIDAQPHPNPNCPGWGWAPDRDTFVDPYGMTQDPCRVDHSLFPQGDGAGTTLLIGWGYNAGTTLAIGAAGPYLADYGTTFFAEELLWPVNLGPADRPDFTLPLYAPLGGAHKEDGRWVWDDPFVQIMPAGR